LRLDVHEHAEFGAGDLAHASKTRIHQIANWSAPKTRTCRFLKRPNTRRFWNRFTRLRTDELQKLFETALREGRRQARRVHVAGTAEDLRLLSHERARNFRRGLGVQERKATRALRRSLKNTTSMSCAASLARHGHSRRPCRSKGNSRKWSGQLEQRQQAHVSL